MTHAQPIFSTGRGKDQSPENACYSALKERRLQRGELTASHEVITREGNERKKVAARFPEMQPARRGGAIHKREGINLVGGNNSSNK